MHEHISIILKPGLVPVKTEGTGVRFRKGIQLEIAVVRILGTDDPEDRFEIRLRASPASSPTETWLVSLGKGLTFKELLNLTAGFAFVEAEFHKPLSSFRLTDIATCLKVAEAIVRRSTLYMTAHREFRKVKLELHYRYPNGDPLIFDGKNANFDPTYFEWVDDG